MNKSTPQSNDPMSDLTARVIESMADTRDPRFKEVMSCLVRKLHEFIREVDLTPQEWIAGIEFLTATGKMCDSKRQEFILLSDTLGASMMVVMLDQARAERRNEGSRQATVATEATVQGPYYWEGAPELPLGSNIAEGVIGEPAYYSGKVTDTQGRPLAGALLDVWSGDGEGNYDMQVEGAEMAARARLRTDSEGRYSFWSIRPSFYPIPMDGPVGKMINHMGRDPNRPGHIHMMVSAPGHERVTTHLFVANSPYIDTDIVFGVRDSLIIEYQRHEPGVTPDGQTMKSSYWSASYDFCLIPSGL
ncbi:MAG: dioxygenase [Pigmentiphaga sp.]|uniref:dioxygenase family protein n=1 Tax=Pigmentiphaga sp. TaxID=1977564 RepID=UPI003B54469C